MILYLDASVLASLFVNDVFSERAACLVGHQASGFLISNFAAAEFAAVVGRLCA